MNFLSIRRVRGWDWPVISLIFSIEALLFIFAVQSVTTQSKDSYSGWMEIWKRWDALHYLSLAENGYVGSGEGRFSLAFFPLYPWLVRAFAFITQDYLAAAFVVSGFAAVAAGLALKRLARLDQSEDAANYAVWFLFIFPTSYFLHIPYTESLFLALTIGCFFAARTDRWMVAGLLGALACLTRVNGLILIPAMMTEAFLQYRATRRIDVRWLWIGLIPLGFAVYLALNYRATGDPLAFLQIQHEHWFKKFAPPWIGIRDVWRRVPEGSPIEGSHEFVYIVLAFLGSIWCAWKLRASYSIWMFGNWLLVTSTSFVVSVPRFTLTLFPLFLLVGSLCKGRRILPAIVTVWSLLYLGLYAGRFARGLWAF